MSAAPGPAPALPLLRFTGIRLIHTALRRDLTPMPDRIRATRFDPDASIAEILAGWRLLSRILMAHHEYEDTRLWPVLRAARPELRLLLNRLEADHHHLDRDLTTADALIGTLALNPGRTGEVAAVIEGVVDTIDAHLRVEEAQILPALAALAAPAVVGRVGTLGASLAAIDGAGVFGLRGAGAGVPGDALGWLIEGLTGSV